MHNAGKTSKNSHKKAKKRLKRQLASKPREVTANIWQNSYASAVKWQCEQQVAFWKNMALRYKQENDKLRAELAAAAKSKPKQVEQIDEEFIAFLGITAKHRIERDTS